jgi:hypothetical protein
MTGLYKIPNRLIKQLPFKYRPNRYRYVILYQFLPKHDYYYWDYIIKVVSKCRYISKKCSCHQESSEYILKLKFKKIEEELTTLNKDSVIRACIDFINFYNKQHKRSFVDVSMPGKLCTETFRVNFKDSSVELIKLKHLSNIFI